MISKSWRLIDTGVMPGSHNMAIDESLLCKFNPELSDPVLRLYGWNPPSLSLGRFQKSEEVLDLQRCRFDSVPIVRRVSGGGAIYHADEITYSIVCSPEQLPPATSVKESFRILTGFLIDFYHVLGLRASYAVDTVPDSERLGTRTAFCFAGKEQFDILIDGNKIGGNAQRRHKNIIFQHGSIPIVNKAILGLEYMNDRSPEHAQHTTSLQDCGVDTNVSVLKSTLLEAFKRQMDVALEECGLSYEEQHLSDQLFVDKYTTDRWNLRGEVT